MSAVGFARVDDAMRRVGGAKPDSLGTGEKDSAETKKPHLRSRGGVWDIIVSF